MPIQPITFPTPTFESSNPMLYGMKMGQELGQNFMMNPQLLKQQMLANALNQYKVQQESNRAQYYPRLNLAEVNQAEALPGLTGAQAAYQSAEANQINYKLQHPWLLTNNDMLGLYLYGKANPASNQAQATPQTQPQQQASPVAQSTAPQVSNQQTPPMQSLPNAPIAPLTSVSAQPAKPQYGEQPIETVNPSTSMLPPTGNPEVDKLLQAQMAAKNYQTKMTSAFNWVHSTAEAKNYMLAQLAGAGVDPSESVNLLSQGYTVPEILKSKGFDPNNPPAPDFLPTTGNITKLKQRQAAMKEVQVLGDFVRDGLGDFSQTIFGMSPVQIRGALTGMNPDKQANFLAARGLAPELANVRLVLAQARTGKYAMQSMLDKSMTNIGAFQSLVTPQVWKKSQQIMDQKLGEAFDKANEIYTVGQKSREAEGSEGKEYNRKEAKGKNEESDVIEIERDKNGNLVRKK